jgi:hypothetical protein
MRNFKVKGMICLLIVIMVSSFAFADFMTPEPMGSTISKSKAEKPSKHSYTNTEMMDTMELGCDMLMRWQHFDGGWMWPEDFSSTETVSTSNNQRGIIAHPLLVLDEKFPAKDYIGDGTWPGARYTGEKLMDFTAANVSGSITYWLYAADIIMLGELTDITTEAKYKARALRNWNYRVTERAGYGSGTEMAEYFVEKRCTQSMIETYGYGLCLWDTAGYALAAEYVGEHVYARAAFDTLTSTHTYPIGPGNYSPNTNITLNMVETFIQRWDVSTSASADIDTEDIFFSAAGNLINAMNEIDSARYASWITQLKDRIIACQDTVESSPNYGAFLYTKYGWTTSAQNQGYAMMGLRNIGEVEAGQKATQWAIDNQTKTGQSAGMWSQYQEPNGELLMGLWEIAEAEEKPWVMIYTTPVDGQVADIDVTFKTFDLDGDPVTVKVEWTIDGGVTWNETSHITGTYVGLSASAAGNEHTITWNSLSDIGFNDRNCKIKITARKDSASEGWGSPAGVTGVFYVPNQSVPVELSTFNIE